MISSADSIKSFSAQWPGNSFWFPALGCQGGCTVLISGHFDGNVKSWKRDLSGRVVSVLINPSPTDFNLVNVYAPTFVTERSSFFQSVHQFFSSF